MAGYSYPCRVAMSSTIASHQATQPRPGSTNTTLRPGNFSNTFPPSMRRICSTLRSVLLYGLTGSLAPLAGGLMNALPKLTGPIPVTDMSGPVGKVSSGPPGVAAANLEMHGYVEEGFFIEGFSASRYQARCSCSPTIGEVGCCDNGTLARLHPSDEVHELLWNRAVTRLVEDRLVLPEDAAVLRAH